MGTSSLRNPLRLGLEPESKPSCDIDSVDALVFLVNNLCRKRVSDCLRPNSSRTNVFQRTDSLGKGLLRPLHPLDRNRSNEV
jgi:hypothetical protein